MRFGQGTVERQGAEGCGLRECIRPFRLQIPECRDDSVGIGQPGVGTAVVWIFGDGLLKVVNRPLESLRRSLVPEVLPFEIEIISLVVLSG